MRAWWNLCDISDYNHCWKTIYLQRNLEEAIEKFVPGESDTKKVSIQCSKPREYITNMDADSERSQDHTETASMLVVAVFSSTSS